MTYSPNKIAGQWRAHGRYIARESVRLAHAVSVLGNQAEGVALADVLDRWQKAGDSGIMIISSEFGERIDLNQLTHELMSRMEKYLGTPLDWVAVPHFNAEHLHVPVSWPPAAESAGNLFVANTTFIGAGTRRADSQGHAGWVDLHGGGDGRARLLRRRRSGASAAINISAIAVDGLGDWFIAEPGMPGICEITTGGIINTIAGIGMCSYDDFMAGKCLSVFGRWRPSYGWRIFPALPWTGRVMSTSTMRPTTSSASRGQCNENVRT